MTMNSSDPLDSRQLQIFMSVASKGSLKAAAAELFVTSSAISHSVAKLEETLGVQLFYRSSKGLVLTAKGELLYRKALPLVAQMKRIETMIKGDELLERGGLRVAAGFNFVSYLASAVVGEYNECFPRGGLRLWAAEREEALRLLADGRAEAAVLVNPPDEDADLTFSRLFSDELRLLVNTAHPLAGLEQIPLRSLASQTLIVSRLQSYTARSVLARIRRLGVDFRECIEVGNTEAMFQMVRLGQGLGLVPEWIFQHERRPPNLVLRSIHDLNFCRTWALVRPRWSTPDARGRTFFRLCQQVTAGLALRREGGVGQPEQAASA
jgi:DNA-binding transcriptional LysR family regulator